MSDQLLLPLPYAFPGKRSDVEALAERGLRARIAGGEPMFARDGRGYVAAHVVGDRMTLRRQVPKSAKGKAARRAERRRRREGR